MSSETSAKNLKDFLCVRPLPDRPAVYDCDRWRIDGEQRVLFLDQAPVPLAPRDFDLLAVLVENAGRVVSKEELLKRVWGPVIVEEGNLASHVSVLRAVLGRVESTARAIETVPKRGYRFAATLESPVTAPADAVPVASSTVPQQHAATPIEASTRAVSGPQAAPGAATPRRRRFAMLAAVIVALAAGIAWWRTGDEPQLPFAERDWLLVADFENHTGDARFDTAMLTALTVSLEQSQFVNVYPRSRVIGALTRMQRPPETPLDEAIAREICSRESIRALVTATITRTGTQYALAARLVDPTTGTAIRSYLRQVPDESQLLVSLQEIGGELRRDLGESLQSIAAADLPLAEVTTPRLEALRLYSQGQRQWHLARYSEAVDAFQAAVTEDPEFAMAHAALGRAYYSYVFNRVDLGHEHFQRALALAARATARERLSMEADFAAARRDAPRAIELYQRYAALYPRDSSVHAQLAQVYLDAGRNADGLASLQLALREEPANPKLLNNAAIAYAKLDKFSDAIPLIERAIEADPEFLDRYNFRFNYATILFGAGERARARAIMTVATRQANEQDRAWRALGLYAQYDGNYAEAADYYRKAINAVDSDDDAALSRSRNHGYLAAVLVTRGDRVAARRELDAAVAALDDYGKAPMNFRVRLAVAYANIGAFASARTELAKLGEDGAKLTTNDWPRQVVEAAIADAQGNPAAAIDLFGRAVEDPTVGADGVWIRYRLARALRTAGERDRARELYQELASLPRGQWLGWEAQELHQLALLDWAQLLAAEGEPQRAREVLARLQEAWRTADEDLEPARTMTRLAATLDNVVRQAPPDRLAAVPPSDPARAGAAND